jgi:catechol 2,3-dioxygenase-like lactoylglutathione lyase family enzyme
MVDGAHLVLYSEDAEADREFFRDVLGFRAVEHGWLIFSCRRARLRSIPLPATRGLNST